MGGIQVLQGDYTHCDNTIICGFTPILGVEKGVDWLNTFGFFSRVLKGVVRVLSCSLYDIKIKNKIKESQLLFTNKQIS